MTIAALFFYLFASVCVASAVMVIAAKNPVHSVLFLILAFVNAAGLFVLLGAEFLAMILIVVYVGAVAVLFLFVVMMLDVDFTELRQGFMNYLPVGAAIARAGRPLASMMRWSRSPSPHRCSNRLRDRGSLSSRHALRMVDARAPTL